MCKINIIIIKPSWLHHYQVYSAFLFQKDCVVYWVGTINNPTANVVILSLVVISRYPSLFKLPDAVYQSEFAKMVSLT